MIKIEKERRYNDFEKEVIKIIVNYEQKALLISFAQIFREISNKIFSLSIHLDKERNFLHIKKEYIKKMQEEKNITEKEEKTTFNTILLIDFSKKIIMLAKLIENLDKNKLLIFDNSYSTHYQIKEHMKNWNMTDEEIKDLVVTENIDESKYIRYIIPIEEIRIIEDYNERGVSISEELKDLVKRDFMTDEEIRFNKEMEVTKKNLKITQYALIFSIIMGIISLLVTSGISLHIYNDNKKSNTKTEFIITNETKKSIIEILNTTNEEKIAKQELKENIKNENEKIEAK